MYETVSAQTCVSPSALVAVTAAHLLSLVLIAFHVRALSRRMPAAPTSSSAADIASEAAAAAEIKALEAVFAAAAAAVERARQRAAAARAAARPPAPPEADADAETVAVSSDNESAGDGSADNGSDEYEVEAIISTTRACDDKSAGGGKAHIKPDCKCARKYLVKWKGYDAEGDNTWESEEQLTHNAKTVLTAFKIAHQIPPHHPSRSSSRSSSNASQTAAAAAAATENATKSVAPPPADTPSGAKPKRANSNTPATNGIVKVVDTPSDGACGAHALCICEGVGATTLLHAKRVYDAIATVMARDHKLFAAAVADEDGTDTKSAVTDRITALRDAAATRNLRSSDFDAYSQQSAHRVAVVTGSSSGATTQLFGRNTATHTAVLIHVGRHYRALIRCDGARTFAADQISDALEFASAHATAWHATNATAPNFPDTSAAERAAALVGNRAEARPKAAAGAPPPAARADSRKRAAGSPASGASRPAKMCTAESDGEWKMYTGKLRQADSLRPDRSIAINADSITAVEQRLQQEADITLSQFARRWTAATGGGIHIEAASPEMFAALMGRAAAIRNRTHANGRIELTAAAPPTKWEGARTTSPDGEARGRGRGGHMHEGSGRGSGRGRGRGSARRGGRGGRGGGGGTSEGTATPAPVAAAPAPPDPMLVMLLQQQRQQQQQQQLQQQLLVLMMKQSGARPAARPIARPPVRVMYCQNCGDPAHGPCTVKRFAVDIKAPKVLNAKQPITGAPAPKWDRTHHHGHGQGEGGDTYDDGDAELLGDADDG